MTEEENNQTGNTVVAAVVITFIVIALYIVLMNSHSDAGPVPCSEFTKVVEKYKEMDSKGNIRYLTITSEGMRVQITGWAWGLDEVYWNKIPLNTTGRFVRPPTCPMDNAIAFGAQNYTQTDEGVNFCRVIP